MTYPSKPSSSNAHADVPRILNLLDGLDLTTAVADVRELIARARHLEEAAARAVPNYQSDRLALARQLSAGELTVEEAATAAVELDRLGAIDGAGVELLREAAKLTYNRAGQTLAAHGDNLIAKVLGPVADKAIADATKAAAKVPNWCTDDTEAIKGEKAVREAWATLTASADTWTKVTACAEMLRLRGFLPVPTIAQSAPRELFEFLEPANCVRFDPTRRPVPALILAGDITNGAGPKLRTGTEVAAHLEAEHAAARADHEQRRATLIKGDAYTSPTRIRDAVDEVHREDTRRASIAALDGPDAA